MQIDKNGVTIIYKENQTKELEKCLQFLDNNSFLTKQLNKNANIVIDVEDFYTLVSVMVEEMIKTSNISGIINDNNFFRTMYLTDLSNTISETVEPLFKFGKTFSPDMIYFLLSAKYYNLDINKIVKELDNRKNTKQLFNWLEENARYDSYNFLLEMVTTYFKMMDSNFYDNLDCFSEKIKKDSDNYQKIKYYYGENRESLRLEKLSSKEAEDLFVNFLTYINAPSDWKESYLYLKENHLIEFTYNEKLEKATCSKIDNKISITSNATTRTFISFVHEFIHYITCKNNNPSFSIAELPSIYYEKIAASFLVSLGYNEDIITDTLIMRNNGNFTLCEASYPLLIEINKHKNNGKVNRENITKEIKEKLYESDEQREELEKLSLLKNNKLPDYGKNADMICNVRTIDLLTYGRYMLEGYGYLTGTMLANQALASNRTDKKEKMIDITENLDLYNAKDIMNYFNTDKKLIKK